MTKPKNRDDIQLLKELQAFKIEFLENIQKKIIGQTKAIEEILIALMAQGHILILGVPGLAKTLIVRSIAELFQLQFRRIQFTPDLMPSDILGTNILQEDTKTKSRHFSFVPGPIFSNFLLADEINRTPPKTQAALLEAMQEKQVTINNVTRRLDEPFFVLATQNPIEQEGTYPLPESQLDRFMFCTKIEYPATKKDEVDIVLKTTTDSNFIYSTILTRDKLTAFQKLIRRIPVPQDVAELAVEIVRKTRPQTNNALEFVQKYLDWGAGPRAAQCLILAAKANAALSGKPVIGASDVRKFALSVLRHRLVLNYLAQADNVVVDQIVEMILNSID
ncbi:MAG: AAA family ATPase [Planctomycetia bacterium]|nr:AAA family ATPase [Planctomycetia bacterium]